ncbi:hypothetical protein C8R44DRAFT_869263 [Mycena epipterygia]|nr:hypothetical protein C8R44DRAFT_869263 [Mycena epipterygia]
MIDDLRQPDLNEAMMRELISLHAAPTVSPLPSSTNTASSINYSGNLVSNGPATPHTPRVTHHPIPHTLPMTLAAALWGERECVLHAMEHIVFPPPPAPVPAPRHPSDSRSPISRVTSMWQAARRRGFYLLQPLQWHGAPGRFQRHPCQHRQWIPHWQHGAHVCLGVNVPRACFRAKTIDLLIAARSVLRPATTRLPAPHHPRLTIPHVSPPSSETLAPIRRDTYSNTKPPPRKFPVRSFVQEAVEMPEVPQPPPDTPSLHTRVPSQARRARSPLASSCTLALRLRRVDANTILSPVVTAEGKTCTLGSVLVPSGFAGSGEKLRGRHPCLLPPLFTGATTIQIATRRLLDLDFHCATWIQPSRT